MIAERQKKPKRSDVQIIHIQYNLGKYFGLTATLHNKKFSKWYLSGLLVLFAVYGIYKVEERVIIYASDKAEYTYPIKVIDGISFLTNLIYIGIGLLGSLFGRKKWRTLFRSIDLVEELLPENFTVHKSPYRFKLVMIIYHVILLIFHLSEHLYWIYLHRTMLIRFSITKKISLYCQTFDVILIYAFNQMLRIRYMYLNENTNSVVKSVTAIPKKEDEERRVLKLRRMISIHQRLYGCVQQLNVIFGWKTYLILLSATVSILDTFNYFVLEVQNQTEDSWEHKIIYMITLPLVLIIIAITLTMSGDGVEKDGRKVTATCYKRLGRMEDSVLRDELLILAKCTEKLQPVMSAAGFFDLNQATLTSMFSFVTTYLIIVIQFNQL